MRPCRLGLWRVACSAAPDAASVTVRTQGPTPAAQPPRRARAARQLMASDGDEGSEKRRTRCSHCGAVGHTKVHCPQLESPFRGTVLCSHCGQPGHNSRSCPVKAKPSRVKCSVCGEDGHNCRTCPLNTPTAGKRRKRAGVASAGASAGRSINLTDAAMARSSEAPQAPPDDPARPSSGMATQQRPRGQSEVPSRAPSTVSSMPQARGSSSGAAGAAAAPSAGQIDTDAAQAAKQSLFGSGHLIAPSKDDPYYAGPLAPGFRCDLPETVEEAIKLAASACYRYGLLFCSCKLVCDCCRMTGSSDSVVIIAAVARYQLC